MIPDPNAVLLGLAMFWALACVNSTIRGAKDHVSLAFAGAAQISLILGLAL